MFWDNLSVPSSGFENPREACSLNMGFVWGGVWAVKMSQYYGVSQWGCGGWLDGGECGSIFNMLQCWATTTPLLLFCCTLSFINPVLSFLPLCSCECSPVARYHTCQNFFYHGTSHPKLHRLPCSLLSQPLASTPLAEITLLRIFTAHTLPCINSRSQQQAFFRILEP